MPIPTHGMSLNLLSTPSTAALNTVLTSITGAGSAGGTSPVAGSADSPQHIVIGTSIIDYAQLASSSKSSVPRPLPLQYFTAATRPSAMSSSSSSSLASPPLCDVGGLIHDQRPGERLESESPHESGWRVVLDLDHQGRTGEGSEGCWRSGENLSGVVQLEPIAGMGQKAISSVIVRVYVQSNTVYGSFRFVASPPQTGIMSMIKTSGAGGLQAITELKSDWHRAYIEGGSGREIWHGGELEQIQREIEGDFPLLGEEQARIPIRPVAPPGQAQTLPFAFTLPTKIRIATSNPLPQSSQSRRELQVYPRTPPSSLPGSEQGHVAIEWIAEVLVRFQDLETSSPTGGNAESDSPVVESLPPPDMQDDLPDFHAATHDPATSYSAFGFLESTPNLQVHRVVFPFEPCDQHAQDLYSYWRPLAVGAWSETVARFNGCCLDEIADERPVTEGIVPKFGRDARDEALGGSNMGPRRLMRGKLVDRFGGRDMWASFEKRMAIKSKIGRLWGWIRVETSTPRPLMIARHAPSLPILMHFSFTLPKEDSPPATRTLEVSKVVITLSRRVLTRSGREERPKFHMDEMRREVVHLYDDEIRPAMQGITPINTRDNALARSRTMPSDGLKRRGLMLDLGKLEGVDVHIDFDMQGEGTGSNGNTLIPGKDLGLSLRMPNVELEYILSVTVHPVGQPSFYALRVPIQIIRGDLDDAPPFPGGEPAAEDFVAPPPPRIDADFADFEATDGLPSYNQL